MKTAIIKRLLAPFIVCVLLAMTPTGEPGEIPLWPNGAPGSEGKTGPEKVVTNAAGERSVSNVHNPSITPYLPDARKATGVAIIIAPGGGHRLMSMDIEGYSPALWLQGHGIAAFVLKYRLAKEEGSTYTVDGNEVADIQRAIRLVRMRAKEWGLDTSKVGVMGFSAGGELAGLAGMRYDNGLPNATDLVDKQSSKPDFEALIYPGNAARFEVTKNSPPVFIACGYKDRPDISQGMAQLYLKYKEANIPAELHIYANIGHGFGLRQSNHGAVGEWPQQLYEWMSDMKFFKK
jgi:acetyl esterase/lipase